MSMFTCTVVTRMANMSIIFIALFGFTNDAIQCSTTAVAVTCLIFYLEKASTAAQGAISFSLSPAGQFMSKISIFFGQFALTLQRLVLYNFLFQFSKRVQV